jgi:mannose-6-phosphate isomerase
VTIEHACAQVVHKPWGSTDLRPWSDIHGDGAAIGELWYERSDVCAPAPALLLKLLFTTEALSIQVHPDETFARSIGLSHGKTEAWYILSAAPSAQIAIGLKQHVTALQLRTAIEDGSIVDMVEWRPVVKGDVIFVPAGTIHAIGPGLVIAEIQQRSNSTFRLFDHGRTRELHVDNAVAVAYPGPANSQVSPQRLTDTRTVLLATPFFVLEHLDLAAKQHWDVRTEHEMWLLVIEGHAQIGGMNTFVGEAIFLDAASTAIKVGMRGMQCLLAYAATEAVPELLQQRFPTHRFTQTTFHHRAEGELVIHAEETRT